MILRCPRTRQLLAPAAQPLLASLAARREAGALRNFAGEIPDPFESALATPDGAIIYPIRSGIPVLLGWEGIEASAAQ